MPCFQDGDLDGLLRITRQAGTLAERSGRQCGKCSTSSLRRKATFTRLSKSEEAQERERAWPAEAPIKSFARVSDVFKMRGAAAPTLDRPVVLLEGSCLLIVPVVTLVLHRVGPVGVLWGHFGVA